MIITTMMYMLRADKRKKKIYAVEIDPFGPEEETWIPLEISLPFSDPFSRLLREHKANMERRLIRNGDEFIGINQYVYRIDRSGKIITKGKRKRKQIA